MTCFPERSWGSRSPARCHDHKFDAIEASDYYALAGFLRSSRRTTAWLDPGLQIDAAREQLAELAETARILQCQWRDVEHLAEQVRTAAFSLSDDPSSPLNARVASDLSHPLSLIARLKQADDADAGKVAQKWAAEIRAGESAPQDSHVFADFSSGVPDGWTATGPAFAEFPRTNAVVPGDVPHPVATAGVSSADLSGHLGGTLASESFELNDPEILIRIAAENARLRLVIEGYVMMEFSALLFQGCTQEVSTDGTFQWIRIAGDVHRHRGRRAHLEIVDEGDGWFVVDQVHFVDQSGAAPPVHHLPQTSLRLATALHNSPDRDPWELAGQQLWPALFNAGLLPSSADPQWVELNRQWNAIAEQTPSGTPVLAMTEGTPVEQPVYIRGNHRNPGKVAPRTFLTAISGRNQPPIANGSGRAELAKRLLDDSNPFPSRVAVNRVWHHLFGRGIVASTDDFGVLGERPTHPQLLDHLAIRFRNSNWSMKTLIGELVRSRTYRMNSHPNASAAALDPSGIWLASARVRRLQAEVIRDAILKISGRLDSQCYGPSVPVALTPEMDGRGRPAGGPLDGNGRRSIYISVNRNFLSPFQQTFDRPPPVTTVGKRTVSNVPAQALILLNSEFVHQQAAIWARRLHKDPGGADGQVGLEETIHRAWQEACGRQPTDQEIDSLREFCRQQAIAHAEPWDGQQIPPATLNDLCHVLFNIKEFIYLR